MGSNAFPALAIRPPDSPLEMYARAMGIREAQQNEQLRAQQIQGAQTQNAMNALALKSQQALVTAGQDTDWSQPDAFDKYMEKAEQGGANPQQLIQLRAQNTKYLSDLATLDKTKLGNEQTKNDALLGALDGISSTDPTVRAGQAQFQARQILSRGLVDNPQLMPLVQKMAAGQFVPTDDQLSQFKNGLTYHSTQIKQALEQQQTKTSTAQQGEAEARAKASGASAEKTAYELQIEKQFGGMNSAMADAKYRNVVMNEKLGRPVSPEDQAFKAAYEKQKTLVPQFNINMASQLTGTALDQMATQFAQTGQLPSLGYGSAGTVLRQKIANRAAELYPQNSLALAKAAFGSNEAALRHLNTQFQTVDAFEGTAIKNLDQLEAAAQKVPDLGARFANVPIRMLNEKMIGTPEMARFRVALATAQTESAKVLNSANATGVLSDSARHEVEEVLSGNLPYPAMKQAIDQLKVDMANRKQSYQSQIDQLKSEIGNQGKPQGTSQNAPANQAAAPQYQVGQTVTLKNGKSVKITKIYPNGTFDAQ